MLEVVLDSLLDYILHTMNSVNFIFLEHAFVNN